MKRPRRELVLVLKLDEDRAWRWPGAPGSDCVEIAGVISLAGVLTSPLQLARDR